MYRTLHTNSQNAVKIARTILQSPIVEKKPILAFVKKDQWDKINHKDEVVTFDMTEEKKLCDFKDKAVVFCSYGEDEEKIIESLSEHWELLMDGDTLKVAVGEWEAKPVV